MIAIFRKELSAFFNSPIGYLIVLLFLVLNGLFLWVFRQGFNIFDYGFADLSNFFQLMPWVFLFLVPALTMRSFSEEKKLGTLELLIIKPISIIKVTLGKFFGVVVVGIIALIPTFIYVLAIADLGTTYGNYDIGLIIGSYFGTFFLLALYCSLGLFASALSESQIVAFIIGATLCFFLFYGGEALATLFSDGATQQLIKSFGAKAHFEDISTGVLDTKDLIYFLSISAFMLYVTSIRLSKQTAEQ
ncbi:MAG: gliding motility-associated ABC transporter permease subunit GldF [Croceivirga sp.]